jgi:hypothetical protein
MRPSNVDTRGEIHAPDQKRTRPSPSAAAGYKKQKRDAEMLTHLFERRLNDAVVQDIFRVTHSHPTILKCANQFNSLILCRPFKVHLASFAAGKLTETAEFQRHIAKFWMPWVRALFLWRQMYGIVPWRIIEVDGSGGKYRFPEIPDFDAGYITTWLDPATKRQRFHYYWHGQPMSEPVPMYWSHSEWQPTSAGKLQTCKQTCSLLY